MWYWTRNKQYESIINYKHLKDNVFFSKTFIMVRFFVETKFHQVKSIKLKLDNRLKQVIKLFRTHMMVIYLIHS